MNKQPIDYVQFLKEQESCKKDEHILTACLEQLLAMKAILEHLLDCWECYVEQAQKSESSLTFYVQNKHQEQQQVEPTAKMIYFSLLFWYQQSKKFRDAWNQKNDSFFGVFAKRMQKIRSIYFKSEKTLLLPSPVFAWLQPEMLGPTGGSAAVLRCNDCFSKQWLKDWIAKLQQQIVLLDTLKATFQRSLLFQCNLQIIEIQTKISKLHVAQNNLLAADYYNDYQQQLKVFARKIQLLRKQHAAAFPHQLHPALRIVDAESAEGPA